MSRRGDAVPSISNPEQESDSISDMDREFYDHVQPRLLPPNLPRSELRIGGQLGASVPRRALRRNTQRQTERRLRESFIREQRARRRNTQRETERRSPPPTQPGRLIVGFEIGQNLEVAGHVQGPVPTSLPPLNEGQRADTIKGFAIKGTMKAGSLDMTGNRGGDA